MSKIYDPINFNSLLRDIRFNGFEIEPLFGSVKRKSKLGVYPNMDMYEFHDNLTIQFELPGVLKDDIKIKIKDGLFTIEGKKTPKELLLDEAHYFNSEIGYGEFTRSFTLPCDVDTKKTDAKFDNGILTITIPKLKDDSEFKIDIN